MYRVLLADDEPIILSGLQSMLDWERLDCAVCAAARDGQQALELVEARRPDIVVCDINMPRLTGLELLEACAQRYPELVFIMLTNYQDFHMAQQSLRNRAVDYLLKIDLDEEKLARSLRLAIDECEKRRRLLAPSLSRREGSLAEEPARHAAVLLSPEGGYEAERAIAALEELGAGSRCAAALLILDPSAGHRLLHPGGAPAPVPLPPESGPGRGPEGVPGGRLHPAALPAGERHGGLFPLGAGGRRAHRPVPGPAYRRLPGYLPDGAERAGHRGGVRPGAGRAAPPDGGAQTGARPLPQALSELVPIHGQNGLCVRRQALCGLSHFGTGAGAGGGRRHRHHPQLPVQPVQAPAGAELYGLRQRHQGKIRLRPPPGWEAYGVRGVPYAGLRQRLLLHQGVQAVHENAVPCRILSREHGNCPAEQ